MFKDYIQKSPKMIKKGYKILLDLLYIKYQKVKVIDVKISDSRLKGKSKMSFKILFI